MSAYLDHAATTPMRPAARAAWSAAANSVGNPSSAHADGRAARATVEAARERIAAIAAVDPSEILFTSGGTEADNLAVLGGWAARTPGRDRIVLSAVEHHAVLDAVEYLAAHDGAQVTWVAPDSAGVITADAVASAIDRPTITGDEPPGSDVAMVSVLTAGNEVGVLHDIPGIAAAAHRAGAVMHTDAVAALGHVALVDRHQDRVSFPVSALGADLVSVTAHKLGGPVGIGALIARRGVPIAPTTYGGGQERRLRSGTVDVAGAAAFAAALADADEGLAEECARQAVLRDTVIEGALSLGLDVRVTGSWTPGETRDRLAGNAHMWVPGADVDALLALLDLAGVSVAAGSACAAGVARFSHVLTAMGYAEGTGAPIRATLGWTSSPADVEAFLSALPAAVHGARKALAATR
ncbi:MAG: cysteine desulfurase family protein [Nostocoides sp.]